MRLSKDNLYQRVLVSRFNILHEAQVLEVSPMGDYYKLNFVNREGQKIEWVNGSDYTLESVLGNIPLASSGGSTKDADLQI